MWIEFAEKKEYENSSRLTGLRISIDKRIDAGRKQGIRKFVEWLRKRYYFPIRCNIYIRYCSYFKKMDDSDVDSIGDFYYSDNKLPIIWIAGYPRKKTEDKDFYVQINASIVYFLTFYYQWFFCEFDKRSDRSLKIEATKWQNCIMDEYLETKD